MALTRPTLTKPVLFTASVDLRWDVWYVKKWRNWTMKICVCCFFLFCCRLVQKCTQSVTHTHSPTHTHSHIQVDACRHVHTHRPPPPDPLPESSVLTARPHNHFPHFANICYLMGGLVFCGLGMRVRLWYVTLCLGWRFFSGSLLHAALASHREYPIRSPTFWSIWTLLQIQLEKDKLSRCT